MTMARKRVKDNRQQIVCEYVQENYVAFERLRHDVISNKVQINDVMIRADALNDEMMVTGWRDITTSDINDIVCDCSNESGLQITAREVLAVLQSHRIPDVHPLREYVLNCKLWEPGQPDWIGWLSKQVTVEGGEEAQKLWRLCFTKWFVAMVASWLKDEVVNQQVLVLIGKQGIFKTTAEISDKLVIKGSIKKPMPLNRLGMVLKKAGYKDVRRGVQRTRGWLVNELSTDDINANRRIYGREIDQ